MFWELARLRAGAAPWVTRGAPFEAGPALYVVLAGAALVAYGGLRLGVTRD